MWETIGWWSLLSLAAYGAITLLDRFYRAATRRKQASTAQGQASLILKLRELPASKQEASDMVDALLAERLAEKEIELTPATRREIRRDVVDELARAEVVR